MLRPHSTSKPRKRQYKTNRTTLSKRCRPKATTLNKLKAKMTLAPALSMLLGSSKTSATLKSPTSHKLLISQRHHRATKTISNKPCWTSNRSTTKANWNRISQMRSTRMPRLFNKMLSFSRFPILARLLAISNWFRSSLSPRMKQLQMWTWPSFSRFLNTFPTWTSLKCFETPWKRRIRTSLSNSKRHKINRYRTRTRTRPKARKRSPTVQPRIQRNPWRT